MFVRYSLRTHDLDAARRFYASALELELPHGASDSTSLEAWSLHERARAAGAPSHWLGHLGVDDLAGSVAAFVEKGASPLGPTVSSPSGASWATLRDPDGAVVALRTPRVTPIDRPFVWHQLHTRDAASSWSHYESLAGLRDAGTLAATDVEGGHRRFSWAEGDGVAVGSIGNTGRWPGVHPHWLFYFPVTDLDRCVARVREHGGKVVANAALDDGIALAVADDPQGAAFGLFMRS